MPANSTLAHADQQIPTFCVAVVTVSKGTLLSGALMNRPSPHKNTQPRAIESKLQDKLAAAEKYSHTSCRHLTDTARRMRLSHGIYICQMDTARRFVTRVGSLVASDAPPHPAQLGLNDPGCACPGRLKVSTVRRVLSYQTCSRKGRSAGSAPLSHRTFVDSG